MIDIEEIPVLLLTGYLGSGKTTLLNRILSNRQGIKFAVIVNDIGEVNIDADLIQQGGVVGRKDESLIALQNGCICCTLKMDLVEQIRDVTRMRRFDYIVIEASGICEPEPIAQTICSIPSMGYEYVAGGIPRLDSIVTVVDALRMRDEFGCGEDLVKKHIGEEDIENLIIQQVEFCNLILLNKASEVTPEELAHVREIIRALQPKAEIIECDYADVDLDRLVGTGAFDYDSVATSATWIRKVEGEIKEEDEDGESHEHHHHHEHEHEHEEGHEHCDHEHGHCCHHHHHHEGGEAEEYGIGTYVYFNRNPIDINKFDHFLAKHWPKEVIRAKGLCYFADEQDVCYLFEQAGKQMSLKNVGLWFATMPADELERMKQMDANLRRDWDEKYGDRMQKLVFIGQHLDKAAIKAGLDECIVEI
ncbi:MAG: GTP-binding protein [Bacteroidales bacterium]|nr:GTP-binding protein [Bacteroidales bacterium]